MKGKASPNSFIDYSLTSLRIRYLHNTSGSGKTRLLLEGLCKKWGFYFTANNSRDRVGSSDVYYALRSVDLVSLPPEGYEKTLESNVASARRRFLFVLYIRSLTFRVFLDCAIQVDGGLNEEHKRRWLLFQLRSDQLVGHDRFGLLADELVGTHSDYLDRLISSELGYIRWLLDPSPIFCVLDEAQLLATMYNNCFRSDDGDEPRPIIRPITQLWSVYMPSLIISGTRTPIKVMEDAHGSAVAKLPHPLTIITNIGAFNDGKGQLEYLKQYLPPGYLDTDQGKRLVPRLTYWLRSR